MQKLDEANDSFCLLYFGNKWAQIAGVFHHQEPPGRNVTCQAGQEEHHKHVIP